MIEPATLRQLLYYDPAKGIVTWRSRPRQFFSSDKEQRRWNTRYAGRRAFSLNRQGYRDGMILRRTYREHHVVWALSHGEWPGDQIDHINGKKDDNRIENLRVVTRSQNCRNRRLSSANTTGVNGVYRHKGKWRATIAYSLGVFDTLEEATAARKAAEKALGFDENHGSRHSIEWSEAA